MIWEKMNMMSLFSTLIMQSHHQMTMRLSYWTTPSVQGEKTNRKLTYGLLISSKANLNFFLVTGHLILIFLNKFEWNLQFFTFQLKVRQSRNGFFQADDSSKKRTNELGFFA